MGLALIFYAFNRVQSSLRRSPRSFAGRLSSIRGGYTFLGLVVVSVLYSRCFVSRVPLHRDYYLASGIAAKWVCWDNVKRVVLSYIVSCTQGVVL